MLRVQNYRQMPEYTGGSRVDVNTGDAAQCSVWDQGAEQTEQTIPDNLTSTNYLGLASV